MTIASATNKSGPYFYNGSATSFAYQFKISNEAHIRVVETVIATGVETDLVLNTDYTVTGVGADAGGNVVISPARAAGKSVTLVRKNPFTQEVVLENQGAYFAKVVEGALDDAVARDQQLQEQISRAVVVPVSADATDLETLIGGVIQLLDNVDAVVTVAGISAAVTTVAANAAPTAIVAGNIDAVVIAASNMATIIAVPALATQVAADRVQTGQDRTAVATNKGLVDTAKTAVDVAKAAADADVVLTHADVVLTHADAVATAADRVQTGLDRIAAAASAAAAAAYSLVTATLGFAAKTTPADADVFGYVQASDSTGRKMTWANIKAALLTWRRSTWLGTVSQSAGVPTGAIIESGSSGAGRWVKYANGDQECWETITVGALAITTAFFGGFRSAGQVWTYPAGFATGTQPTVMGTVGAASAFGVAVMDQAANPTGSLTYSFLSVTSVASADARIVEFHAKGRWY